MRTSEGVLESSNFQCKASVGITESGFNFLFEGMRGY